MNKDRILNAGPFTVLYQNGFLRYVKYGSKEIVRMMYFALRDENWGTYEAHIENEQVDIQENSFTITYDCFDRKNEITIFHWEASIRALPSGEITFEILGRATTDVLKNRAGFCILHPIKETIGQPCEITHVDGTVSKSIFPKFIAPENPFKNVSAMQWSVDDHTFELVFEGDVFETEDQRNWTDASFKTFCTPLDLPFPVTLKKDNIVKQKITFKPKSILPEVNEQKKEITLANHSNKKQKLPTVGIAASTETDDLTSDAITLLRELNLSHYRIEVYPLQDGWVAKLSTDYGNATALNLPLEVAVHVTDQYKNEMEAFVLLCQQNRINIKYIILFSIGHPVTQQDVIDYVPQLKQQLPNVLIGAGTDYNFTELNRNHFHGKDLDFITFSIHPQEHAFDDLSLMETIEAQNDVVESAQHIYPEIPIYVSPLTLRKRNNPYASNPLQRNQTNEQKSDPRQKTEFNSKWTLESIQTMMQAGARSITFFQTVGEQGIMAADGNAFPVYFALLERKFKEFG